MPREVKNDRISKDQLSELVRQFVRNEVRRKNGTISTEIPAVPARNRFLCPWRSKVGANTCSFNEAMANNRAVLFYLTAGASPLYMKRLAVAYTNATTAANAAHTSFSIVRGKIPTQHHALSSSNQSTAGKSQQAPVCMNNKFRASSIRDALSNDNGTSFSLDAVTTGGLWGVTEFGSSGVFVFCPRGATRGRETGTIEWKESDDSDLFVLKPFTSLIIAQTRGTPNSTSGWVQGCLEWEE